MEPVSLERKVCAVLDLGAPLVPEDDRLVLARKASSRVSVDKLVRAQDASSFIRHPPRFVDPDELLHPGHRGVNGAIQIAHRHDDSDER